MKTRSVLLVIAATTLLLTAAPAAPALAGFAVPPGYEVSVVGIPDVPGSPGFLGGLDYLSGGALVYYDGYELLQYLGSGVASLYSPDPAVWGSFVKVGPSDTIYFGESLFSEILEIDPAGGATAVATVPGNFDLEFSGPDAFISHNPGWDPENQVSLLDLDDESIDLILQTDSWSGPIAFDDDGALYYCRPNIDFGVPGSELYRFSPAQVDGAVGPDVLTFEDGELVTDEITGCYDMDYAPNAGGAALFVSSGSLFTNQVEKVDLSTGVVTPFVTDPDGTAWSTFVRFRPGANPFVAEGGRNAGVLTINQIESIIEIRPAGGSCFIGSVM